MAQLSKVREQASLVLATLRQHSRSTTYISVVEEAIAGMDDPATRVEAVRALRAAAHLRCLGDIYLEGVPGFEWPEMVGELSVVAGQWLQANEPGDENGEESLSP